MTSDARETIERLARQRGFHAIRFAAIGPTPHYDAFQQWLLSGAHADMSWLEQSSPERADPRSRLPTARSAIALSIEHHHHRPPDPGGRTGIVARYAWGRDYHNLIGKRLKKLREDLRVIGIQSWGGVDTAPILERPWAAAAGLGFTGKNTLQIWPARTSWMFLAILFVDAPTEPDPPLKDHCGRCTRCLTGCPTQAFVGPRHLDARRCISYWTIEARGLAPRELRSKFGRWILGCDVCQEVCPHNTTPPDPEEDDLLPRHAWLDLDEILATADDALEQRFIGTPLRRPGAIGLKRNCLVALGNLKDPGGEKSIETGLIHPSPVVRSAAVWAAQQIGGSIALSGEADPSVLAELTANDCR